MKTLLAGLLTFLSFNQIQAFPKLAIHYPIKELNSEEYLFVGTKHVPLYADYLNQLNFDGFLRLEGLPSPLFIIVPAHRIKERYGDALVAQLMAEKEDARRYFQRDVDSLNATVKAELDAAGIPSIRLKEPYSGKGIPYQYVGVFGEYAFIRKWSHWEVLSKNHINLTEKTLAEPNDSPELILHGLDLDFAIQTFDHPTGKKSIRVNGYAGNKDPRTALFIYRYHIDDEEGLKLFRNLVSGLLRKQRGIKAIDCASTLLPKHQK